MHVESTAKLPSAISTSANTCESTGWIIYVDLKFKWPSWHHDHELQKTKQKVWGSVHTTVEKFKNAALFPRLGLPSTLTLRLHGRGFICSLIFSMQLRLPFTRRRWNNQWNRVFLKTLLKVERFQNDTVSCAAQTGVTVSFWKRLPFGAKISRIFDVGTPNQQFLHF